MVESIHFFIHILSLGECLNIDELHKLNFEQKKPGKAHTVCYVCLYVCVHTHIYIIYMWDIYTELINAVRNQESD